MKLGLSFVEGLGRIIILTFSQSLLIWGLFIWEGVASFKLGIVGPWWPDCEWTGDEQPSDLGITYVGQPTCEPR